MKLSKDLHPTRRWRLSKPELERYLAESMGTSERKGKCENNVTVHQTILVPFISTFDPSIIRGSYGVCVCSKCGKYFSSTILFYPDLGNIRKISTKSTKKSKSIKSKK